MLSYKTLPSSANSHMELMLKHKSESLYLYYSSAFMFVSCYSHLIYLFHVIHRYLDLWFGPGNATNDVSTIEQFKISPGYEYTFGSAVGYKLITFEDPDTAILSIRGTQTVWE